MICSKATPQSITLRVYEKQVDSLNIENTSLKQTFKNYTLLSKYADSVFKKKQRDGYLEASYTLLQKNDSLYIQQIINGRKQQYIELTVDDFRLLSNTRLGISLSRKRNSITLPTKKIDSVLQMTHQELLDDGQLFNKLYLDDIRILKNDTVTAKLKIEVDTKRTLDRIVISGYDNFPKNVAANLISKKNVLNKKTLDILQSNLKVITYAAETKSPEFLFKRDSTLLYIYIKKINSNTAEGFLGFNNAEGKSKLTGNLQMQLANNLNKGERLNLKYRSDDNKQRLLEASVEIPYLLGTKLGAQASINLLRRDTIYQNNNFKAGLFFKPQWNQSIGINYVTTSSVATSVNNLDVSDITSRGIEATYNYEQINSNKLKPVNTRIALSLGLLSREIKETTPTNQTRIGINAIKQVNLLKQTSLFIDANLKMILSNDIRFNELYQLGGENTIRGFRENSIDTNTYITLKTELRQELGSNFYAYSILDAGRFEDFNSEKTRNIYAVGAGIAILTQSGILRVSVANGTFDRLNLSISNMIAQIKFTVLF